MGMATQKDKWTREKRTEFTEATIHQGLFLFVRLLVYLLVFTSCPGQCWVPC